MLKQIGHLKNIAATDLKVGDIIPTSSGQLFAIEHLKFVEGSRVLLQWGGRTRTVRNATQFLVLILN